MTNARELRNTDRALLRRIQRQMDKAKEESPIVATEEYLVLREARNVLEREPVKKQTRLGLYKHRGGRR